MKPKAKRAVHPPVLVGLALAAAMLAGPCRALTPEFTAPATATATRAEALTSLALPVGPFGPEGMQTETVEGALDQTAWRLDAPGKSTLELLAPLRAQLLRDGYSLLYECETNACGGFDFRYGSDILPEPDMHVDLGDFRYVAAAKGKDRISLLVSRSASAGYVQLTLIRAAPGPAPALTGSGKTPLPTALSGLAQGLETGGALALDDLVFASGSAELEPGEYGSLTDLAAYLKANPDRSVAIVGHTDASGGLEANIALSRKRAEAVRAYLAGPLGVPAAQMAAEGVGFLAPRASNLTEDGRSQNRRVEVMLTSTR